LIFVEHFYFEHSGKGKFVAFREELTIFKDGMIEMVSKK
jgi:hypothetical protein|tara:strand:- start:197 stop:313 length:117 start_codon:yes stop_codon:yes gene_type:complete